MSPTVKQIQLLGGEADIVRAKLAAYQRAQSELINAATLILAREGIKAATVEGIYGDKLVVTVPAE